MSAQDEDTARQQQQQQRWELEPISESDLDEVLEIELQSHPTAWPRALFAGELELSWSRLMALRSRSDGRMLGYIDYWLVHDELHVLNVAVAPEARRQGCARYMLDSAIAEGRTQGVEYVTLEVRVTNAGAIRLYETMGFAVVGRRRAYYSDTGEDALIMALELGAADDVTES